MVPENRDGLLDEEPVGTSSVVPYGTCGSDRVDLLCLRTLGALTSDEVDALALVEGTVTRTLDLGEVHEKVLATVIRSDEAEALFCVEPLNDAFRHAIHLVRRGIPLHAELCTDGLLLPRIAEITRSVIP